MFKLEIKTGGAAFCDPYTGEESEYYSSAEVARLLRSVAAMLEHSNGTIVGSVLMDINGNKVGQWELD